MRRFTYRTKALDLTHTELVAAAKTNAAIETGTAPWEVVSVEWYGDDRDTRATVELVAPDPQPEVET